MAIVRAIPFNGINWPMLQFLSEREITDDLPGDVIGECATEAINKAWKAGHDPAASPFFVMLKFE